MAIVGVTATATGDQRMAVSLRALSRGIRDFRPLWNRLEIDFYHIEDEQFATGGRSNKWQALSPAYARRKDQQFPGRLTMERTGALMDSLTVKGAPGRMLRKTETEMEIGTAIPYAEYHQRGGAKMPRRKVIDFTPADERAWEDIAREWIDGLIGEVGLR